MEGPPESVLLLDQRNPTRLLQLSGDPSGFRTRALPESAVAYSFQDNDATLAQLRRDVRLVQTFLVAIEDISGGGSPLVTYNEANQTDLNYHGVDITAFSSGDKPLAQIGLEVPLYCADESMKEIKQILNAETADYTGPPRVPFNNDVLIPDCEFNTKRPSGIHNSRKGQAEILERIATVFYPANYSLIHPGILDPDITADFQGQVFAFTPSDKTLARDRNDWRKGRVIPNVSGAKIGDILIQFNTTVLATGDVTQEINPDDGVLFQNQYKFLVSNVIGECPPLPSGRSVDGVECLVFPELNCLSGIFQEELVPYIASDFQNQGEAEAEALRFLPPEEDDFCQLQRSHIVWGRNFVVDGELLATVSGVLTNSDTDNSNGSHRVQAAIQNSALAALVALATTGEKPSIESQVSPQINVVFIFFMLLPLSLTVTIFIIISQCSKLPVPIHGWELMVLGREEDAVPTRKENEPDFPKGALQNYELAFRDVANAKGPRGRLGIYESKSKLNVEKSKTPIEPDIPVSRDHIDDFDWGSRSKPDTTASSSKGSSNHSRETNDPPGQDAKQGDSMLVGDFALSC